MRNLVASWLRKGEVIKTISYKEVDNALPRLTYHVMQKGHPGDVIEVTHRHTGLWLGSIKVGVGKLNTNWIWEH